jgi:uncharacterized protein YbaA (DUF1428 family)
MKILLSCLAFAVIASAGSASLVSPIYELRTYTAEPNRYNDLVSRLADASPLFAKHGMTNVVYWTTTDAKEGEQNKVIYLLGHKNREAAAASWKAFIADPAWHAVRDKNEATGKVVTKVDSVFLAMTDYSPAVPMGGKMGGVFELRTYITPEGKLADLDARFRNHTMKLFEKHGMTNGPYFHPIDADKGAANTLIYWLRHESREAAAASFKAFGADPAWVAARDASEKNGKLTSSVKSTFLKPLEYSPLK